MATRPSIQWAGRQQPHAYLIDNVLLQELVVGVKLLLVTEVGVDELRQGQCGCALHTETCVASVSVSHGQSAPAPAADLTGHLGILQAYRLPFRPSASRTQHLNTPTTPPSVLTSNVHFSPVRSLHLCKPAPDP